MILGSCVFSTSAIFGRMCLSSSFLEPSSVNSVCSFLLSSHSRLAAVSCCPLSFNLSFLFSSLFTYSTITSLCSRPISSSRQLGFKSLDFSM
uniref:Uncharacterized protein n=1 Tax=Anguilla anguilla TaxID=7936 RepID=A0A0E9XNM4_ANGAN